MTLLRSSMLILVLFLYVPLLHGQQDVRTVNVTFTTIDVPGAGYTGVFGINSAGEMVGNYGQNTNLDSHGFLYSNGTFTYFDYPGETVTVPTGINDSGLIVGYAGQEPVVGFLYDGTSFTTIKHGSDSATFSFGINNAGEIVGGTGTIYTTKGFAKLGSRFKVLNVQGQYVYIYGSGVNKSGKIVGWAGNDGFQCNAGTCQIFDFPGATQTEALGINDSGLIVGWYSSSACVCAFISKNGKYLSFSYPGAAGTFADGINASGQIVGQYTFDYQAYHGFVTNPITSADF
jgi:probable HAF family extracellular repeat protein